MRWQRNQDDSLILQDANGTIIGGVWPSGNGFKAAVFENRLWSRTLLGSFGGSQAAKRAVEVGVSDV